MTEIAQKIEALLFVAGQAVPTADLAKLLSLSAVDLQPYIQELDAALQGHGVSLLITSDAVQLVTSPSVSAYVKEFMDEGDDKTVSKAAAETLALVSYRGPLSRYEIEAIRGVDSRRIVSQLVQRGLVKKIRRESQAALYDVTEEFFQHVGVTRREDLPQFADLSSHEAIQRILSESKESSV